MKRKTNGVTVKIAGKDVTPFLFDTIHLPKERWWRRLLFRLGCRYFLPQGVREARIETDGPYVFSHPDTWINAGGHIVPRGHLAFVTIDEIGRPVIHGTIPPERWSLEAPE